MTGVQTCALPIWIVEITGSTLEQVGKCPAFLALDYDTFVPTLDHGVFNRFYQSGMVLGRDFDSVLDDHDRALGQEFHATVFVKPLY